MAKNFPPDTVQARLKRYVDDLTGGVVHRFCALSGISQATMSNVFSDRASDPSYATLWQIKANIPIINLNFVFTGDGDPYTTGQKPPDEFVESGPAGGRRRKRSHRGDLVNRSTETPVAELAASSLPLPPPPLVNPDAMSDYLLRQNIMLTDLLNKIVAKESMVAAPTEGTTANLGKYEPAYYGLNLHLIPAVSRKLGARSVTQVGAYA